MDSLAGLRAAFEKCVKASPVPGEGASVVPWKVPRSGHGYGDGTMRIYGSGWALTPSG